jgi:hypothetical protein
MSPMLKHILQLGPFLAGIGVPIVIDGVLQAHHVRFGVGLSLGIAGSLMALLAYVADRRTQASHVPATVCPRCGEPLRYYTLPLRDAATGLRPQPMFSCRPCGSYWLALRGPQTYMEQHHG